MSTAAASTRLDSSALWLQCRSFVSGEVVGGHVPGSRPGDRRRTWRPPFRVAGPARGGCRGRDRRRRRGRLPDGHLPGAGANGPTASQVAARLRASTPAIHVDGTNADAGILVLVPTCPRDRRGARDRRRLRRGVARGRVAPCPSTMRFPVTLRASPSIVPKAMNSIDTAHNEALESAWRRMNEDRQIRVGVSDRRRLPRVLRRRRSQGTDSIAPPRGARRRARPMVDGRNHF